jgi:hypothetical protein
VRIPGHYVKFIALLPGDKDDIAEGLHTSCQVGQVSVMAYVTSKTYHTHCPTYGYWFERFILGCHKRMGDMVVSDCALSIEIFKELLVDLEKENG